MSGQHTKRRLPWDARYTRFLLRRTLRYFIYTVIPTALIFVGFFVYVNANFYNEARAVSQSQITQTANTYDLKFEEMRRLAAKISMESDVRLFMTPSYSEQRTLELISRLKSYSMIYRTLHSVVLYAENSGNTLNIVGLTTAATSDTQWLQYYNPTSDQITIGSYIYQNRYPYVMSFIKPVIIEKQNARGAAVVNVDLGELNAIVNGRQNKSSTQFYILGNDMRVLLGPNLKAEFGVPITDVVQVGALNTPYDYGGLAIPQTIITGDKVISLASSQQIPVIYMCVTALSVYWNLPVDSITLLALVCLASFIISLLISFLMTAQSLRTIRLVLNGFADPEKANLAEADFRFILQDVLKAGREADLQNALAARLYMLRGEQAAILFAQISPHFLYNTLDTISWMAYADLGGQNRVSDSLATLSELFRYTLRREGYICVLRDELEHMRVYAELLRIRHGSKLQVNVELDARFDQNASIRFLLQPLLENAVTHGMKPLKLNSGRHVTVILAGFEDSGALVLTMTDDGAGITDSRLAEINQNLEQGLDQLDALTRSLIDTAAVERRGRLLEAALPDYKQPDVHGFGLNNVNNRLKLIFGREYGLSLCQAPGGGVMVRVRLPLAAP
ncbi:histidine kinase [Clostridia bacterium]|nr:histidine kinase [Clostridia bacterium]